MGKKFAMLSCGLARSRKIRSLKTDSARWAYVCAHTSEQCNYLGMFRYPVDVWANDAGMTSEELTACIDDLIGANLIEYDFYEETVRIVSWYYKSNAPNNADTAIGRIRDYRGMDYSNSAMYCRSVAEFIVGSIRSAQRWKPDSPDRPKLYDALETFVGQVWDIEGQQFPDCLKAELKTAPEAVRELAASEITFLSGGS